MLYRQQGCRSNSVRVKDFSFLRALCLAFCFCSVIVTKLSADASAATDTSAQTKQAVTAPMLGAPAINNYDPKEYKSHSQNWVAVQDARGVMYFGNSNGILEFDGQRWQLVVSPGNLMVRAMTIAADKQFLWFDRGLRLSAISPTGKVHAVSLKDRIPNGEQMFNDVWQVESTSSGVYFLTRTKSSVSMTVKSASSMLSLRPRKQPSSTVSFCFLMWNADLVFLKGSSKGRSRRWQD